MGSWPKDVGILALEIIFPSCYVDQSELEQFDGVSAGKYTIGLGQQRMGFCSDREDINSLCLTVVQKLLENYHIKPEEIGRLEVGTETIIDKSKSTKSVLMQLFEPHGVTDLEGIDTTNACYGGTAALFNSIAWVESSAWNGRYALAVAADIAVYAKGPARPTGGAGAVAMLIGPNAPLVFERGTRATFCKHTYDFYKPDLSSEYPVVDGKLTVQYYLNALDNCYQQYCKNVKKKLNKSVTINDFGGVIFHSPYCKLVQKSLGRLMFNDFIQATDEDKKEMLPESEQFLNVKLEETYFDRDVEKAFLACSKKQFLEKTSPGLLLASQVGNMYTSSVYASLASLLMSKETSQLVGENILIFSYGAGLASSIFSVNVSGNHLDVLENIVSNLKSSGKLLEKRHKVEPKQFEATLESRKEVSHNAPYSPSGDVVQFFPGTYYLANIDDKYRRTYERTTAIQNGHS